MKFVADTNIILSALLWRGLPYQVLEGARQPGNEIFTSPAILSELDKVLRRPKFYGILASVKESPQSVLLQYAALATLVHPVFVPEVIERDPDDNIILSCAIAAGASHIVSGDTHLLDLGAYGGIEIVNAADFLKILEA